MQSSDTSNDIPIAIEGFEDRGLTYRPSKWRAGRLMLDGNPVKTRWGRCTLRDNQGREVPIRLRHNGIDPIPKVEVAGRIVHLAPPLKWYEYAWAGIPLLLLHIGGALGGAIGGTALYANIRVFRTDRSSPAKYATAGAITLGAAVAYFIAAVALLLVLRLAGIST